MLRLLTGPDVQEFSLLHSPSTIILSIYTHVRPRVASVDCRRLVPLGCQGLRIALSVKFSRIRTENFAAAKIFSKISVRIAPKNARNLARHGN